VDTGTVDGDEVGVVFTAGAGPQDGKIADLEPDP
jgi:hypothetical protein